MITKIKRKWFIGNELTLEDDNDIELNSSWYSVQNYFNDGLKHFIVDGVYTKIIIEWQGKNFEFKRKTDDD